MSLSSWRKLENENGYPFYYNEMENLKQWDHPNFGTIKQEIDDCNYIKYSTYRIAMKFRVLQRSLFLDEVSLNVIAGVFQQHKLGMNESSLCLESCDLEAILSDIYFAANKLNHSNVDMDLAADLTMNLLYNIFDRDRKGKIQVSSTKLLLAILSNSTTTEVHNFLFALCADHNNCITRLRLRALFGRFIEITSFLHEDVTFGQHLVAPSIDDCFSNSPGLVGINESNFVSWLENEPQLLAWITVLRRLKSAESVIHPVRCTSCKASPLMGLKYRCLKCMKYIQCQKCFFLGTTNGNHKLTHSMKEYCAEMNNSRDFGYTFVKKLCGFLQCPIKLNETKTSIMDVKMNEDSFKTDSFSSNSQGNDPNSQLQIVIKQLETQNRELQRILLKGKHNENQIRNYLEGHRKRIASQIDKLKNLKDYLNENQVTYSRNVLTESTPLVKNSYMTKKLDPFSPINETDRFINEHSTINETKEDYSMANISTWIGAGCSNLPNYSTSKRKSPVKELHNDLDDALAKLQQILANNFILDESLGNVDNIHLKNAVSEVEDMLTSFIDTVESSRASSVQRFLTNKETELL